MKNFKIILCVLGLAAIVIVGCGGGAPAPAAPTAASQQPTTAANQQPTTATTGEKVSLVYWSMWNEPEPSAVVLKDLIAKFEAKYPNITITPVWNGRENQTKVRTALGSNTPIDLVDQDQDQIAGGLVKDGLALPLDDLLKETALDESAPLMDVFNPGVLDLYVKDGVHYMLPYDNSPVMFWYNKDMFTKAGITAPPQTWEEFLAASQKLKDSGVVPIAAESDAQDYQMFYFSYLLERMKGKGFLLSAIEDKTGNTWNDPAVAQAVQMVQDLWAKGYIPAASSGYLWPAGQQTLATGKAAMELVGAWLPNELRPVTGDSFNWGGFRFPTVAGGKGDIDDLQNWQLSFIILKNSAHPKEAAEFLKFIMTKDAQTQLAQEAIQGATHKGITWPTAMGDGQKAAGETKTALTHADGGTYLQPEYTKNVLFANFQQAFLGKLSPAEFQKKMVDDSKKYWENH